MPQYFILIKRKGAKSWSGAIPTKKNVTLSKVKSITKKRIKKGYMYRIVTISQLRNYMNKKLKQKTRKRKTVKKRTRKKR